MRGGEVANAANALSARAFSHDGDVYIPPAAGPLTYGPGRALLAHELTHVRQLQDSIRNGTPATDVQRAQADEQEARSVESWWLAADMALGGPPPGPTGDSPPAANLTGVDTRHPDGHVRMTARPADPPISTLLPPAPVAASTNIQRAEEAAPAPAGRATGGPAGGQMGERELEDLLRRLYPKLRTQLSRELLVARERAGLLTDLR